MRRRRLLSKLGIAALELANVVPFLNGAICRLKPSLLWQLKG